MIDDLWYIHEEQKVSEREVIGMIDEIDTIYIILYITHKNLFNNNVNLLIKKIFRGILYKLSTLILKTHTYLLLFDIKENA